MDHLPQTSQSDDIPSALPTHQRVNGFERPFSRDQVISWIGHSVSGLSFFIGAAGVYLCTGQGSNEEQDTSYSITTLTLVAVGMHVVNSTILVTSWRSFNYAQFFTVACTGTVQFVLQVVYAALCLLWLYYRPLDTGTFGYVVESCLVVCLVMSIPCMFMYFVLVGFHLWLMVLGYGTYEWMLRRRKEQRAKLEAKKQKKHTATSEIISTSTRVVSMSVKDSPAVIKATEDKLEERDRELTML
ncbi:unnamed protein product [Peronospora destructor]|uniref:Transmembrane protein n=1 Tax=Peronospora destructor TaxID=86335 RepID=A0AAV0UMU2_9STRA|nr:unnamed protein product [Peronospora destructor]